MALVLLVGCTADPWLTADQQGRRLLERGDAVAAAGRFEDPAWRATACYRAENYGCALDALALLDTPESAFNGGNAQALRGELALAVSAYDRALSLRPGWQQAEENRALVQALIDAEQDPEDDEGEAGDPTFDADEVRVDDKGKKGKRGEVPRSALTDEAVAEMWLRAIETSPGDFLRLKFAAQAAHEHDEGEAP